MIIKEIKTQEKLKEVFDFLSQVFWQDAEEYNEHYYPMYERYNEIVNQFHKDNELLLYIEENDNIIGALTSKNMNKEEYKITIGIIGIKKEYRRKGYAKLLIEEFEKRCRAKGIKEISLGSRFRACNLYISLGYIPMLLVQVSDFATTKLVKSNNKYNYQIINEYQIETNGAVFFKINNIEENVIDYFEKNVPTAHASYVFTKELN